MAPAAPGRGAGVTPRKAKRRVGAFFDFDDTVIRTSAGRLFGFELLRIRWRRALDTGRGTLGWLFRLAGEAFVFVWLFMVYAVLWLLNRLGIVKRSTVVRTAYRHMRGWPQAEIEELSADYFDDVIAALFFPDALEAMEAHKAEGHIVVVATTNMAALVENIKRYAPVDHVIGTDFVVDDGVLTGRITGPTWGEEKAEAVREWAHANGVSLPLSHGYTDHYSDVDFLKLFGHPHVVNPPWRLRRLAKKRGWEIHRWRPAERTLR